MSGAVKDAAMPMDPVAWGLKPASKGAKGETRSSLLCGA